MAIDDSSLGCGRSIDGIWANIESAPDAHEARCPDCLAARQQLAPLAVTTRQLHDDDIADADLRPRTSVKANIMQIARAEVRRGRRLPLTQDAAGTGDDVPGSLQISEQAIAGVVRTAADRLEGLQARRCSVQLVEDPSGTGAILDTADHNATGRRSPTSIKIVLRISVSSTSRIPELVDQLRGQIARAVTAEVGIRTQNIDVVVDDVHDV